MRIEAIALHLRPRPMSEAADLGVRMVQAHARSVWASFLPLYGVVVLMALSTGTLAEWLPPIVIFWLKPWLDRTLLFVLSRAAFGMPTRFADVWQARRAVWWQQLAATLTARRFSPWRSYVAPAQQLEGLRGSAARARRLQLLRGKQGAAFGMNTIFGNFEAVLMTGAMLLRIFFAPEGTHLPAWLSLFQSEGIEAAMILAFVYAAVVAVLEPFYVGAGFAMYLNRRVELEAWDIEQEFRLAFSA